MQQRLNKDFYRNEISKNESISLQDKPRCSKKFHIINPERKKPRTTNKFAMQQKFFWCHNLNSVIYNWYLKREHFIKSKGHRSKC